MNAFIYQHSTNDDDPNGSQRRFDILQRNLELLEFNALKHQDAVFVLLDLTREGKEIPEVLSDDNLKEFVVQSHFADCIPTQIIAIPRWTAYKAMKAFQRHLHQIDPTDPKISPVVEKLKIPPPMGHFSVMVISGGKQLANLPIPQGEL